MNKYEKVDEEASLINLRIRWHDIRKKVLFIENLFNNEMLKEIDNGNKMSCYC